VERELSEYRGKNRWPLQFEGGRLVRSQVQTITGSDGSFCCSGLDPSAVYAVAVRDTAMRWIAAVARPDGDAVHLVVDRQFVRLDVQGGSGDALVGANVAAEGYDPASRYPIDKIRPGFPATGPSVIARFYPADAQGRRLLLSPFGWVWRIGSFDEIAQADFLRHEALAGVYRVDLQLRLRAETHFGSLQVEVVDEQGRPFRPFNVVLQCLDKDAGRQSSSQSLDADHMLSDLPAGRWQLTVRAGAEVFFGGYCYARGSHVREIQIGDQQTTKVRVEAPVAGLATFRLRSNPAPAPLNWGEFALRSEPGGVALPCFPCEPFTRAAGPVGKAVGEDLLYIAEQAFPPGRHTFVVEAKGYQPARCEVEIVADRCVEAVVDLVRQ